MKAKIFQALGGAKIGELDVEISDWIERSRAMVVHISTSMVQNADSPNEERQAHLVVTILYE